MRRESVLTSQRVAEPATPEEAAEQLLAEGAVLRRLAERKHTASEQLYRRGWALYISGFALHCLFWVAVCALMLARLYTRG